MRQLFIDLLVSTQGIGLIDITEKISAAVMKSGIVNGMVAMSILHTSASLLVQESASSDVQYDLLAFFDALVPMEAGRYRHAIEGLDDMPAHIKSALTTTHMTLSWRDSQLCLGQWQGVFLFEHRQDKAQRDILLHVLGE